MNLKRTYSSSVAFFILAGFVTCFHKNPFAQPNRFGQQIDDRFRFRMSGECDRLRWVHVQFANHEDGGLQATSGYDLATGLGSLDGFTAWTI